MRRHPADRQLLPRQRSIRAGDRVLAPTRGRIIQIDRRRHLTLLLPDRGDPEWMPTIQIVTAAWEPVVPCPGCGLPAHRDTGCHICRPAPPTKEPRQHGTTDYPARTH